MDDVLERFSRPEDLVREKKASEERDASQLSCSALLGLIGCFLAFFPPGSFPGYLITGVLPNGKSLILDERNQVLQACGFRCM